MDKISAKLASGEILNVFGHWGVSFARDILSKFNRYGKRCTFSSKQMQWIDKLAACVPQVRETVNLDASGLLALFNTAAAHLKFPKIRLRTADNLPIKLHIVGERSKHVGSVQISDGGSFGANRYYGRIDPATGAWILPASGAPESVKLLVLEMSKNPAETAAKYGKITGSCCFCSRGLEDERSLNVGYGPICANNYGLPWGE